MTHFRRRSGASGTALSPLSTDRIAAYLRSCDYEFGELDEDVLIANWIGNHVLFLCEGENSELLSVRGIYHRSFAAGSEVEILHLINDWHRRQPWPKAYTVVDAATDELKVYAAHAYDLEAGIADGQLEQTLWTCVSTIVEFFVHLDRVIPPPPG